MNDLLTIQQLAEHYGVATSTIRRWIADCEIDVAMVSTDSTHTNYYELSRFTTAVSKRKRQEAISKLPSDLQQAVKTGLVVETLKQTPSGRQQLEAMMIGLRYVYGDIDTEMLEAKIEAEPELVEVLAQIPELKAENERLNDIALSNAREYNKLLKYVPDQHKSKEQRDWDRATSSSSLRWMFEGRK
jgi:transposase-like protein